MMGDMVVVKTGARDVHPRWKTETLEVIEVSDNFVYVRATAHGKTAMVGAFEHDQLERIATTMTNNGQVRVKESE